MIPEFPTSTTIPHTDHSRCADPHECLVEALTYQADWAVLDRRIARHERVAGQEFHITPVSC